jgi:heat shock protein HslJ
MKSTLTVMAVVLLTACASRQKISSTKMESSSNGFAKDSIEYYETDYDTRQYNDLAYLIGNWNLNTMQRQARIAEENLGNAKFSLGNDGKFRISTTCGYINGDYTIKGRSIKFSNASGDWFNCADMEQASTLVKLLNNTVSAYTVSGNSLLLRDGASNVVFTASR